MWATADSVSMSHSGTKHLPHIPFAPLSIRTSTQVTSSDTSAPRQGFWAGRDGQGEEHACLGTLKVRAPRSQLRTTVQPVRQQDTHQLTEAG